MIRPHQAEAVRIVRHRYKIPDTVPDHEVARLGAVAVEELAIARRNLRTAVLAQFQRYSRR